MSQLLCVGPGLPEILPAQGGSQGVPSSGDVTSWEGAGDKDARSADSRDPGRREGLWSEGGGVCEVTRVWLWRRRGQAPTRAWLPAPLGAAPGWF